MRDTSTEIKAGRYQKNIEVLDYFNQDTGLNLRIRPDDNTFLSGWT